MSIENFSFLIPGELAGMAYPRSIAVLEELAGMGFRSLVALGDPPPRPAPDTLRIFHKELPDFSRIPADLLHAVVNIIRDAPRMTAVCCGGGIGRTGVALACTLVSQGRDAYQAIAEVRTARPGSIDDPDLELSVHDYSQFLKRLRSPAPEHRADHPEPDSGVPGSRPASGRPRPPSRSRPSVRGRPDGSEMDDERSVFLMMRYRDEDAFLKIEQVLCAVLSEYSMRPRRADWVHEDNLLWSNVCSHMERSGFGVAVLEHLSGSEVSPNVCLELGYMLAHHRPCLLLKEKGVPKLQADLAGHLYKDFDAADIGPTVEHAVRSWLQELGIAKKRDEKLLVFVSAGGTCRDPMAKVILKQLLGNRLDEMHVRVEAMARGEPSGPGASSEARAAIREIFGKDLLADHRTARLTPTLAEEADLILVMDSGLRKGLPLDKTFTLKRFLGRRGEISDPWRPTPDMRLYRKCAAELREIIAAGLDRFVRALS